MRLFTSCICFLFITLFFNSSSGQGFFRALRDYENSGTSAKRMYQRSYLGFGVANMDLEIQQKYYYDNFERIIKLKAKNVQSYSVTQGYFFPISTMQKNKSFGVDISSTVSLINYEFDTIHYSPDLWVIEKGFAYQSTLPIALVYKSGGEVSLHKKDKFLFMIGAGIAPTYSLSKIVSPYETLFTRNFVTMEMGYFFGLAIKFRATAFFGSKVLIDSEGDDLEFASHVHGYDVGYLDNKVIGKTQVNLSLLLMPFSWDWKSEKGKGWEF